MPKPSLAEFNTIYDLAKASMENHTTMYASGLTGPLTGLNYLDLFSVSIADKPEQPTAFIYGMGDSPITSHHIVYNGTCQSTF